VETFQLITPRLILRPHTPEDVAFMVALNSDPEVVRYTGDAAELSPETALAIVQSLQRQWTQRRMGRLMVQLRDTGEPLGWADLKWLEERSEVDLGYRFLRRHWGKGYATEAARVCLDFGFGALGLTRLVAEAAVENTGSVRVLEKLGFQATGRFQDAGMEMSNLELHRR